MSISRFSRVPGLPPSFFSREVRKEHLVQVSLRSCVEDERRVTGKRLFVLSWFSSAGSSLGRGDSADRREGRGPTWSPASYRVCVSVGPPTHDGAPKRIGGGPKVFERKLIFNFMLAPGHFRLAPQTRDNPIRASRQTRRGVSTPASGAVGPRSPRRRTASTPSRLTRRSGPAGHARGARGSRGASGARGARGAVGKHSKGLRSSSLRGPRGRPRTAAAGRRRRAAAGRPAPSRAAPVDRATRPAQPAKVADDQEAHYDY